MATSRFERFLLTVLSPKVGIPLLLFLALLAGPLIYRGYQVAGLPDIGAPFDVETFGTVEIDDENNAYVEYKAAATALVPLSSTVKDEARHKAEEEGWLAASDEVRKWVEANRPIL